jgi:hypothetical protein
MHFISGVPNATLSECNLTMVLISHTEVLSRLPKTTKACLKCGDFEHEHVKYYYQLYILVEDDEGQQLMISIDDKVFSTVNFKFKANGNQCPLLNGIERTCIQDNRTALGQLRERLEPIMGNLPMVHNALKAGKRLEVSTSEFHFDLEGWLIPGGKKKAFRLVEYEPLTA